MGTVTPPKLDRDRHEPEEEDDYETSEADLVAERIEAGYDIQADASQKPMTSDPASSSADDDPFEK